MGIILANIIAIYRRELQSYFASPFAYIIAGVFWLFGGCFFYVLLLSPAAIPAQVALLEQQGYTQPIDVPYEFLKAFLTSLALTSLFIILPMLSMGLYTEERKRGTLELLATSPITNWAVALGKLLGALTFFITMVLPLLVCELIALGASNPPIPPSFLLLGHLALILLAAAVLSLGMFLSSLTDSVVLAAILTAGLGLFLWLIDFFVGDATGAIADALNHLSLLKNFNTLTQGILDSSSLILFVSYIILGIFLTVQAIEAFKFQRS